MSNSWILAAIKVLAAKRMQWVTLEKPKGTIQKSKFDKDREKINKLLKLVSTPTISPSTPTLTKEATVFPMAVGNTNVCTGLFLSKPPKR